MAETPKFIQGVYSFRGAGLERAVPLQPAATHKVPFDKRAHFLAMLKFHAFPTVILAGILGGRDVKSMLGRGLY